MVVNHLVREFNLIVSQCALPALEQLSLQMPRLFPHGDARSWYAGKQALIEESAFRNSLLQGGYFIVAARLLGLDTNPMSGFESEKVNSALFAGTAVRVNFISTRGYGEPSTVYPRTPRFDFREANRIE